MYDAILLYARTATKMIENGEDFRDAVLFVEYAKSLDAFEGKSGTIKLDENGDLKPNVDVYQVNPVETGSDKLKLTRVGRYFASSGTLELQTELKFPGGSTKVPHALEIKPEKITDSILTMFQLLSSLVIVYCIVLLLVVYRFRFTRIVRAQSPDFLIVTLLGTMVAAVGVIYSTLAEDGGCTNELYFEGNCY